MCEYAADAVYIQYNYVIFNICYNHFLSDFMMHHGAAGVVVVVVDKNISNVTKIFYCLCGSGGVRGDRTAKWARMKIK